MVGLITDLSTTGALKIRYSTKRVQAMVQEDQVFRPRLKRGLPDGARITESMKNLMGVVWDRGMWHRTDLHQCIADYATYRKPTLNVLDAYNVMKQNGPRGVSVEDIVCLKAQLISTDMVAIDTAGAKLFGMDPGEVRHITLAAQQKVGRMDLDKLNIKRISL